MAQWADPRGDLRILLADTTADNLVKDKPLLPTAGDGANRTFITFDDRLTTSGHQSALQTDMVALRVFANNTEYAASGILVTNAERGELTLMTAPALNARMTASYHHRQHLDSELDFFLTQATALVTIDAASNVPTGLQAAVLRYAAAMAHERLAQRWQQRKVEQFMLQDVPLRSEAEARVSFHQAQADRYHTQAGEFRLDYYNLRMDRGTAPAYGLLRRTPRRVGPQR